MATASRCVPLRAAPREGNAACRATARRAAELRTGSGAEYVDDDVVVISGAELDGLVVLPRHHIGGLEELSITSRANVLAAVRRAARSVKEKSPWSAASLLHSPISPASQGHMCIRVLPGRRTTGRLHLTIFCLSAQSLASREQRTDYKRIEDMK